MITSVVKQLGYRALRRAAIGSWSLRATRLPLCIDHRYRYTLGKRTGATARHLHLHNIRTYNYKRTHIFTAVVPAHSRHNSVTQLTTCISQPRWRWPHSNSNKAFGIKKTRIPGRCLHDPTSSHFSRTPTCDRHRHAKTAYSPPSQLTTVATVTCQKMLSRSICLLSWAFMAWSINMCTIQKTTMLLLHTKLISMTVVSCCCWNLK